MRAIGHHLVEATCEACEPREKNWFRQNLAIAVHRCNAFSILSAGSERLRGLGESIAPPNLFLREFPLP